MKPEESIGMVRGNDNNEGVDPDCDVQTSGIPEPLKASQCGYVYEIM